MIGGCLLVYFFERAKTAERTRNGELQKARSGKVVGGHLVNYGFRMNAARDAYEVDKRKMSVARCIFRMIGEEGLAITAVAKVLNEEHEPGPTGGSWYTKDIRSFVLDAVYKPHPGRGREASITGSGYAPGPGQALRDLVVQPRALAAHQDRGAVAFGRGARLPLEGGIRLQATRGVGGCARTTIGHRVLENAEEYTSLQAAFPLGASPYASHASRRSLSHASRNLAAAILAAMSPSVRSSTSL